jgi:hypothetical protein
LSWGYVLAYLHGGPRIVDATSYTLQARTFASGHFSWPLLDPEASTLGRFVVRVPSGEALNAAAESAAPPRASGIFPPGYPALLALGYLLRVPLLVGPLLAALLVVVSAALAKTLALTLWPDEPERGEHAARLAATCSMLSAALRYHTADTMAHGLAALCFGAALLCAMRLTGAAATPTDRRWGAALGLAGGALWATRPASALALAAVVLLAAWPRRRRFPWLSTSLGALPGVALWLAFQSFVSGSPWHTAQHAYYAVADGPPGCFRYGFGADVGCLGEHGDFVRHNLARGYDAWAALGTSLRRVKMHLGDALNSAPLFALVVAGMALARGRRRAAMVATVPLALLLAYAPFYFDGNYPGGGGRMLVDGIAAEHALASCALLALATTRRVPAARAIALLCAVVLLGFALETGRDHAALRDREGGEPMFMAHHLVAPPPLLFVDTDHGFNLAFDPSAPERVVRRKGDDLDRIAWEARGRPDALLYRYSWHGTRRGAVTLEPLRFDRAPTASLPLRIEGESLWPPLAQENGYLWPSHRSEACVSRGRVLALQPHRGTASARVALPVDALAGRTLSLVVFQAEKKTKAIIAIYEDDVVIERLSAARGDHEACFSLAPVALPAGLKSLALELRSEAPVAIDKLVLGEKR